MRFGISHLSCGFLPSMPDEGTKAVFSSIFTGKYQPVYVSDMDGWYKSHLAFILPICYVCDALDCDLTKIRGKQLDLYDGCRRGGLCNAGGAWVSCFAGGE